MLKYLNKLGYACINLSIKEKSNHKCILKNWTDKKGCELIKLNLMALIKILNYNKEKKIKLFRISSEIIPFATHEVNTIKWWLEFQELLNEIKLIIKNNKFRVSMHPGQYSVLNSIHPKVVINAIKDIEYHSKFLDCITDTDYKNKVIIHIGGVYNEKEKSVERFINNFYKLNRSSSNRLVIENDEKSYNVDEVLYISDKLKIPVIFDNLHNEINPVNETIENLLNKCFKTWKRRDGVPKIHYSEQDSNKKAGSHSQTVNPEKFISFFQKNIKSKCDVMLEVKDKNISVEKILETI